MDTDIFHQLVRESCERKLNNMMPQARWQVTYDQTGLFRFVGTFQISARITGTIEEQVELYHLTSEEIRNAIFKSLYAEILTVVLK